MRRLSDAFSSSEEYEECRIIAHSYFECPAQFGAEDDTKWYFVANYFGLGDAKGK